MENKYIKAFKEACEKLEEDNIDLTYDANYLINE